MTHITTDRTMMESTSTGGGAIVLGAAVLGYQDFAAFGAAIGDTFDYVIFEVDPNGVPSGAFETGEGTITDDAPYTFTRVMFDAYPWPADDTAVDFGVGGKYVAVTRLAAKIKKNEQLQYAEVSDASSAFDNPFMDSQFVKFTFEGAKTFELPDNVVAFESGAHLHIFNAAAAGDITLDPTGTATVVGPTTVAPGTGALLKEFSGTWYVLPMGASGGGAASAEDVSFAPAGNIEATDVQAAIEELDNAVSSLSGGIASGTSFPGSPTDGQRFFRTDYKIPCIYIAGPNAWYTEQVFVGQAGGPDTSYANTTTVGRFVNPNNNLYGSPDAYLMRARFLCFMSGTGNWTMNFHLSDGTTAATSGALTATGVVQVNVNTNTPYLSHGDLAIVENSGTATVLVTLAFSYRLKVV